MTDAIMATMNSLSRNERAKSECRHRDSYIDLYSKLFSPIPAD